MKQNKIYTLATFLALFAILLTTNAHATANQTNYTSNTTYTAPSNVYVVFVEAWGAGGGGGGAAISGNSAGGGGGGGAYAASFIYVTPGANYTITVANLTPSITGSSNFGFNGSDSWFNSTTTLLAQGGRGAQSGTSGTAGAAGLGGNISLSVGQYKYAGGNGGTGNAGTPASGGAGGGAGTTQSGQNASGINAGSGGNLSGGAGGAGRSGTEGAGNPGVDIGGGGAGALCNAGCSVFSAGTGARGEVRVTAYTNQLLQVNIYNETNLSLITGTTFTVTLTEVSTSSVYTYTTTTGIVNVDGLNNGSYTVQISGGTWQTRSYIVTVVTGTIQTLNAYMTTSTNTVSFIVHPLIAPTIGISGATVNWETIINSTFTTVESRYTDISGTAGPFSYSTTGAYRTTITASGYTTKQFILSPVQSSSYDAYMLSTANFTNPQDYSGVSITFTPKVFQNAQQNNFTFIASSPNGTLSFYNYTISYPTGTVTNNGSNVYGSTLTSNFNITGSTIYSNVTIDYCYTTSVTGQRCFREIYPINGIYGNYTLYQRGRDVDSTQFEKVFVATSVTAMVAGGVGFISGPIGAGVAYLLGMAFFYRIFDFSVWILLIEVFIGFMFISLGNRL